MASSTTAFKKIRINGALYRLNPGVQVWKRKGRDGAEKHRIVTRIKKTDGTMDTKFYEMSAEGVKLANAAVGAAAAEVQAYGTSFGALSVAERQAIELYRAYARECVAQGVAPTKVLAVMCTGLEAARATTSAAPTFAEVTDEYFTLLAERTSAMSFRIQSSMGKRLKAAWGPRRIHSFKEEDVRAFMASLTGRGGGPASAYTMSAYFTLIRALFKLAAKKRLIKPEDDPTFAMKHYDTGTAEEPEVLTAEDARALLRWVAASPVYRDLLPSVVIGLFCGVRSAERSRMHWADVRPGGRDEIYLSRTITKTSNARMIPVSPTLSAWLDYFKASRFSMDADALIVRPTSDCEMSGYNRLTQMSSRIKADGLRLPKNCLRHTAASCLCVLEGRSRAAEILGHSEQMLVQHYRHALTEEEARELMSITPEELGLVVTESPQAA